MELSESSIYLSLFDTCSYDLLLLRIVSHSFSSSASSDLLFRKQRESCRALLKGIKSCLVAPTHGNLHLIQCAVHKGSISSLGDLNKLLAKLDLEVLKKEAATLKILQLCLSFSLEACLCLKWNKISKWLLQGGDILRNNGAIPAIELGLLVAASQVCFTLKAGRLKVFPFDISELGLDPEILQYFLNDENAIIISSMSSAVRLGATVHVLPSLRQASIESISRQIPPLCPYKRLSSFIEHWKFTYGLEIPNDPSSTYYVNVKFSPTGTTYTYPHWCVHSRSPVILRRFDPIPILQDFINDVNELQMGLKLEAKGYKPVSSFLVTDQVLSPAFQNLEAHLPAVAGPYRTVNPRPTLKQQSIFEMLKNIKSPTKNETSTYQSHSQRQNLQTMNGNAPVFRPTSGATSSSSQSEICATPSEKAERVQPFVSETGSQLRVGNVADVEVNGKESYDVMNKTGLPLKYFQSQFITPKLNAKPWFPIKHPELDQAIADKDKANHTSKAGAEADGSSKYFLSKATNPKLPFKPRDKGRQTKLVPVIYIKTTDSEKMPENLKSSPISESEMMIEAEILKNQFSNEIIEIATSTADSIYPFRPNLPQGAATPFQAQDYDFISKAPIIGKKSEKTDSDSEHYSVKNDKPTEIQANISSGMYKESILPHDGRSSSSTFSSTPSRASQNVVITNLVKKPLQFGHSSVKSQVEKADARPGYASSTGKVNPSLRSNPCRAPELNEAVKIISGSVKLSIEKAGTHETQTDLPNHGYSCSQGNLTFDSSACGTPINCGDKRLVKKGVKVSSGYVKSSVKTVTMHRATACHLAFSSSQDNRSVDSMPISTHHPQIAPNENLIKEGVKSSSDSAKQSIEKVALTIQKAIPSSSIQGHPTFKINPCGTPQAIANNHLVNKVVRTGSSFAKRSIEKVSTPAAHDKIVPVFVKKKLDSSPVFKPIIDHNPKPQKLIPSFMLKKKPTFSQAIGKDESVKNMVRENDIANKIVSVQGKRDCRNDLITSSKSAICLEKKVPIFSQNKIQKSIMSSPALLKRPALDFKKKQKASKECTKLKDLRLETAINASTGNKMLVSYCSSPTEGVTSPQINSITSRAILSITEPSIFERLSELDLKKPAEFRGLGKDFAETGKKRKKNNNQSSQNENGAKKPRAPPKIATDVNVEELAKLGQLSIANVPTITAWLKAKGVQVKSKDKRQDLVNKVHQSLGLPIQF